MFNDSIAALIPHSVAIENNVVPVREIGTTLVLATSARVTDDTEAKLRFILNRDIRFVFRSANWLTARLHEFYGSDDESRSTDESDTSSICWYWPNWHWFDGTKLVVKCSGWNDSTHWSGCEEFPAHHADYEMWRWIVSVPQYHRLVDEKEEPRIRRIWNRYIAKCRPTWFCRKGPPGTP